MYWIIILIASFAAAVWATIQLLKPAKKLPVETSESSDHDTATLELASECELQPEQPKDDTMQRVTEYVISGEEIIELLKEAGFHLPEDTKNVDVLHFSEENHYDCPGIRGGDPILVRFEETASISGPEFRKPVAHPTPAGGPVLAPAFPLDESLLDEEFTTPGNCVGPTNVGTGI